MAQGFSFGFGGDDIENAGPLVDVINGQQAFLKSKHSNEAEPAWHDLKDFIKTLPGTISYCNISISSQDGRSFSLPRREIFDIRAQYMAENLEPGSSLDYVLSEDDLKPNIYEGGFKTWECAVDLASYLYESLSKGNLVIEDEMSIVELGAGTGLPSASLLYFLLRDPSPSWRAIHLSVSDFNKSVLELACLPNLLLTWHYASLLTIAPSDDLAMTPDLLDKFQADLAAKRISISGISGAWGQSFNDLIIPFHDSRKGMNTSMIILASETIYSPQTIRPFSLVLMNALRSAKTANANAKALVAAKGVYFGVGGGVDEFLRVVEELGGRGETVWSTKDVGVRRVILEISMRADY